MNQVVKPWKKRTNENRKKVLKLEIDYELVTLYDAIIAKDIKIIEETKVRLEKLRSEMLSLEV
ncbi:MULTISPECIES: hypothetical protein [Bacillus]|uniref:hypothetical protein n=1 Tax=Bacillus TaxID=1386 RepID=UPI000BB76CE8|nr:MULTISPECIES: hypothetical protein [Bacillus]